MTQYTRDDGVEASQMMWDAGRGGGGSYVYCQCGKEHSFPPDLTDEEYDAAERFGFIELDDKTFVYGCEGCAKKLLKYENFFWQSRNHIRQYLKIRIDQEKIWADQEQLLNILAGIK
jgi:hypothetical protein